MRPRTAPEHVNPRPGRGPLSALGALIIILASGCDNVSWGGVDFDVVPPPERAPQPAEMDAERAAAPEIALPVDPVLFVVRNDAGGARMRPLAAVGAEGFTAIASEEAPDGYWRRFITEFMRQGSEFSLYREGHRTGTFVLSGAEVAASPGCPATAVATGSVEIAAGVPAEADFLALPEGSLPPALDPPTDSATRVALRSRNRQLGPILAERLLRARRAGLPGNWQAALAQVVAFPTPAGASGLAATLLVGDTLGPGLDDQGYALFFLATPSGDRSGTGLDTVYADFADYPVTGKSAPRVVDYLDWDRDGWPGFVLEVFGTSGSRVEMLTREDGDWARSRLLECGLSSP